MKPSEIAEIWGAKFTNIESSMKLNQLTKLITLALITAASHFAYAADIDVDMVTVIVNKGVTSVP